MSVENNPNAPEQDHTKYGVAEVLDEGTWQIGELTVTATGTGDALASMDVWAGAEKGEDVRLSLSAKDLLQLADLVEEHRSQLENGYQGYSDVARSSVFVSHPDAGPEPIPTNRSKLNQTGENEQPGE